MTHRSSQSYLFPVALSSVLYQKSIFLPKIRTVKKIKSEKTNNAEVLAIVIFIFGSCYPDDL